MHIFKKNTYFLFKELKLTDQRTIKYIRVCVYPAIGLRISCNRIKRKSECYFD